MNEIPIFVISPEIPKKEVYNFTFLKQKMLMDYKNSLEIQSEQTANLGGELEDRFGAFFPLIETIIHKRNEFNFDYIDDLEHLYNEISGNGISFSSNYLDIMGQFIQICLDNYARIHQNQELGKKSLEILEILAGSDENYINLLIEKGIFQLIMESIQKTYPAVFYTEIKILIHFVQFSQAPLLFGEGFDLQFIMNHIVFNHYETVHEIFKFISFYIQLPNFTDDSLNYILEFFKKLKGDLRYTSLLNEFNGDLYNWGQILCNLAQKDFLEYAELFCEGILLDFYNENIYNKYFMKDLSRFYCLILEKYHKEISNLDLNLYLQQFSNISPNEDELLEAFYNTIYHHLNYVQQMEVDIDQLSAFLIEKIVKQHENCSYSTKQKMLLTLAVLVRINPHILQDGFSSQYVEMVVDSLQSDLDLLKCFLDSLNALNLDDVSIDMLETCEESLNRILEEQNIENEELMTRIGQMLKVLGNKIGEKME